MGALIRCRTELRAWLDDRWRPGKEGASLKSKRGAADPTAASESAIPVADLSTALEEFFQAAEATVEGEGVDKLIADHGDLGALVATLASIKHASRGALLTLLLYKYCRPSQDIRHNKVEHPGGFSARAVDTAVTVPFLLRESLPRNVESHWLSQTISFAEPWTREVVLKTQPRAAGPLLIDAVNRLEELSAGVQQRVARDLAVLLLCELIDVRNRGQVHLTRPKDMTISSTLDLLQSHFREKYKAGAPRLPQVAMYAIYQCLFESGASRYQNLTLEPLRRMKSADRKAGTVGDVVVSESGRPVEAVETKFDLPVTNGMVAEAMEKIRTATVLRYFVLSTAGISPDDESSILRSCKEFRKSNGCEIIVNGVFETLGYYLRLLPDTTTYIDAYATLVESDDELDYEHRVAWNSLCAKRSE